MTEPLPGPQPPQVSPRLRLALTGVAAAGLVALILIAAAVVLARSPRLVLSILSARLHRRVTVDGGLDLRFLPGGVEVAFRGAHVGRPAWAGPGDALTVESGRVRFAWSSVLHLRPVADLLQLDGAVATMRRDRQGRPDWSTAPGAADLSQPLTVRRLAVTRSRLRYADAQSAVTLDAAVSADPDAADGLGLHVDGAGVREGAPWRESFRAPAVGLGERRPFPVRLALDQGPSHMSFAGELPPGLDAARLHGDLSGSGADLHDFAPLLHAPFPHTPAYRLTARFARAGQAYRLNAISGRVGSSDVFGDLTVTEQKDVLRLDGAFRSPDLQVADLLVVVSGGQAGGGGRGSSGAGRLFPDVRIDAAPLRPLVGVITLEAPAVQPTVMSLRALRLRAVFDHGRVTAEPLTLDLLRGATTWRLALDVRGPTPSVSLDLALQDASTADLLGAGAAYAPIQARLDGHVRLAGRGPTLHAAAADASGEARLRATGGLVRRREARVLGGDLGGALVALLRKEGGDAPLRCLAADLGVAHGHGTVRRLVFATPDGRVTGTGGFDLGAETVDVTLRGEPARRGLVAPGSSVRVTGPLARPSVRLDAGGLGGFVRSLLSLVPSPLQPRTEPGC